jgi:hypothetical protein
MSAASSSAIGMFRLKLRRTQYEQMFSALPSNSDICSTQSACLKSADIVAKVENRTTLKISRKLVFGLRCCCVAFQRPYAGP